jgi:hypothetical protein
VSSNLANTILGIFYSFDKKFGQVFLNQLFPIISSQINFPCAGQNMASMICAVTNGIGLAKTLMAMVNLIKSEDFFKSI